MLLSKSKWKRPLEKMVAWLSYATVLFLLAGWTCSSCDAALQIFTDRAAWRLATGGGTGDLTENFDRFNADVPYDTAAVVVGFLTLSKSPATADTSLRIDAIPASFTAFPDVNRTTFATSLAFPGGNTVLSHAPLAAIGFDFGRSPTFSGTNNILTSLSDATSFANTATTGGVFGIVYNAGECLLRLAGRQ